MRKFMIEANETLLTIEKIGGGKPFMGESPFFGKTMTVDHVLEELGDHVQRVFRINTDTLAAPEDITEAVAREYLFRADNDEFGIEEDKLPPYVLNSSEWKSWQVGAEPAPFGVNSAHRLALALGTMDAQSQGLVRGASL